LLTELLTSDEDLIPPAVFGDGVSDVSDLLAKTKGTGAM
jgi:hypothetical protein